jgi:hypothetical protein
MLTWFAFWFAFRSPREKMWQHCGIVGIIAGAVNAYLDYQNVHSDLTRRLHPEYAVVDNHPGLMATGMLLDFVLALAAVLSICWFGWLCRWCFIWRKETEHPPVSPIAGGLWHLGNFGWKLVLVIAAPIALLVAIVAGAYSLLPTLVEKTATFKPPPPAATATIVVTPSAPRALPIVTPTAPRVERALPVPTASPSPSPTQHKHHAKK